MDFHVRHRWVLVFEAALISSLATAEQGQFPETGIAMFENASEKQHTQRNVIAIKLRIFDCLSDLLDQFRGHDFICVEKQNPVVRERESIHGPLTFLWPSALIVELYDHSAVTAGDLDGFIGALRVDDTNLCKVAQGRQAGGQIARLISSRNDHTHRKSGSAHRVVDLGCLLKCRHCAILGSQMQLTPTLENIK